LATEGGIVKITTIGDAYLAVSGPSFTSSSEENGGYSTKEAGALAAVRMACSMILEAAKVKAIRHSDTSEDQEGRSISIRIGCATGKIFGAILGTRQFQWQVWGDALLKATRYEETGKPGEVHISRETCMYAREAGTMEVEENNGNKSEAKVKESSLTFEIEQESENDNDNDNGEDYDEFAHGYYARYTTHD
jgi:class 3 adenylate cyclase